VKYSLIYIFHRYYHSSKVLDLFVIHLSLWCTKNPRTFQNEKLDEIQTEMYRYLQKILFFLFANVRKCSIFGHMHSIFAKSTKMTEKEFGKFLLGYQKTHNFMKIQNFVKWTQNNVPEKSCTQKHCQKVKNPQKANNHFVFCP
jgi:hypothetical protein